MNTPLRVTMTLLVGAAALGAQQPQPADSAAVPVPAVGESAPDFSFRAIDSQGIAANPRKLSDHRGQTVVLWFFIKARTRG
jgi:hypothetical protein